MQGHWVSRPEKTVCLVFIHGILSDAIKCWTHKSGTHWPTLAATDPSLADVSVYNFSFETGIATGDYGIGDAADALKELAGLDGIIEFPTIIFVCHSLGGIVARRFVVDNAIALSGKKIGLFLLGSPSRGSRWANLIAPAARIFRHEQARILQLTATNTRLADLDKSFRNLIHTSALAIVGKELLEDRGLNWLMGRIVEPDSAALYFPDSFKVPGSDHSSISKPDNVSAIQHRLLSKFVRLHAGPPRVITREAPDLVKKKADPLFEIYTAINARYYIERGVETEIFQFFDGGSTWISGRSGTGKTSLVRRWLDVRQIMHLELALTSTSGGGGNAIKEIADTLAINSNSPADADQTTSKVVDLLIKYAANNPFVLFVDEVGIESNSQDALRQIIGLLDGLKRKTANIRVIVCSINQPVATAGNHKFYDFFSNYSVNRWDDEEISILVHKIFAALPEIKISNEGREHIVRESKGNPRFAKAVLRDLKIYGSSRSLDKLIDAAKQQLGE